MSLHVKICGISDAGSAMAAAEAGADAIGFVFYPRSPRLVSPERARSIAAGLPEGVETVAVFLRPSADEMRRVLDVFDADRVQADADFLGGHGRVQVLPVFREGPDLEARLTEHGGGRFLLEGRRSGVGERVDWARAAALAQMGQMTLAGGLNPDNVAEAIGEVHPFGVDVSSGVESRPGVKDPHRIREFVVRAREMVRT
jgi:phosphoribosylanthranilate isomerase